jgi:hypothetical protein
VRGGADARRAQGAAAHLDLAGVAVGQGVEIEGDLGLDRRELVHEEFDLRFPNPSLSHRAAGAVAARSGASFEVHAATHRVSLLVGFWRDAGKVEDGAGWPDRPAQQ